MQENGGFLIYGDKLRMIHRPLHRKVRRPSQPLGDLFRGPNHEKGNIGQESRDLDDPIPALDECSWPFVHRSDRKNLRFFMGSRLEHDGVYPRL